MTNKHNSNIIGSCGDKNANFIVWYNGSPAADYAVILCEKHIKQPPFNRNILKIIKMGE